MRRIGFIKEDDGFDLEIQKNAMLSAEVDFLIEEDIEKLLRNITEGDWVYVYSISIFKNIQELIEAIEAAAKYDFTIKLIKEEIEVSSKKYIKFVEILKSIKVIEDRHKPGRPKLDIDDEKLYQIYRDWKRKSKSNHELIKESGLKKTMFYAKMKELSELENSNDK